MFFLRKPTKQRIDGFLAAQADAPFSYAQVGATRDQLPSGYQVDQNRVRLGEGEEAFRSARAAILDWSMYPQVVELHDRTASIEVGTTVAPLVRLLGVWGLAVCRIVYVIDERDDATGTERFGFAYGTLAGHPMRGEERFLVERDANNVVWYDLSAFSRPRHWMAWLALPWVRRMQKQFAARSLQAMLRCVPRDRAVECAA